MKRLFTSGPRGLQLSISFLLVRNEEQVSLGDMPALVAHQLSGARRSVNVAVYLLVEIAGIVGRAAAGAPMPWTTHQLDSTAAGLVTANVISTAKAQVCTCHVASKPRRGGETGKRSRFKLGRCKACGFDSRPRHSIHRAGSSEARAFLDTHSPPLRSLRPTCVSTI